MAANVVIRKSCARNMIYQCTVAGEVGNLPDSAMLARGTYISQCKVSAAVQRIEERQHQRRRHEKYRSHQHERSGEKLQGVQHPPREQTEESAHRLNVQRAESGLATADTPARSACSESSRAAAGAPPIRAERSGAVVRPERSVRPSSARTRPGSFTCSSVTTLSEASNTASRNGSAVKSPTASSRE